MLMRTLDLVVLRTFIAVVETGTLAAAAVRVGRSESAVSLQLKKLEDTLGEPVFDRTGRKLALTEAGSTVLSYAYRLLDLNEEALQAARAHGLDGEVSLGVPQDFAETWLPALIGRFRRSHPGIKINVGVDRSASLQKRAERGEIDLALVFADQRLASSIWTIELPMTWIGQPNFARRSDESVSLAVFDPPCAFRAAAATALERAGIEWAVTFTSPSLAGLWAAIDAGLGISVRTPAGLPSHLAVLPESSGLPALPKVMLSMHAAAALSPAGEQLQGVLIESLTASLSGAM
jgi:DNA-binding transcriptional LysR family regulator